MSKLVVLEPEGKTRDIKLDRERITIGRRADNDVCLPHPAVSSEHAVVLTVLSDSFLEDLDSTNGTLVNGRPIAKHLLRDRDRIDIGRQELIYLEDESAVLEPTMLHLARVRAAFLGERVERARPRPADVTPRPVVDAAQVRPNERQPTPAEATAVLNREEGGRATVAESGRSVFHSSRTAAPVGPTSPMTNAASAADSEPAVYALRVLTGTSADRLVPLVQDETFVGRAGVQVVAIRRLAGQTRVVPVEGARPPSLNGLPLPADGERLAPGDILEVAGTKLRMIALADDPG